MFGKAGDINQNKQDQYEDPDTGLFLLYIFLVNSCFRGVFLYSAVFLHFSFIIVIKNVLLTLHRKLQNMGEGMIAKKI